MNILDILKRKKTIQGKPVYASGLDNKRIRNSMKDQELVDVPIILFGNDELQVTVGQWLGLLPAQKSTGSSSDSIISHLDAKELMESENISTEKLLEIEKRFGHLLKLVGVPASEICNLSQFNSDETSFHCSFINSGKGVDIALRWGDMLDYVPAFIIQTQGESKTYEYVQGTQQKPSRLNLQNYTIQNPENGNTCFRFLSSYDAFFTIQNGDYNLTIDISRPEGINGKSSSQFAFRLNNEDELQQYLLGLTFPIKIHEVYKKIRELSTGSVNKYPHFEVKLDKKQDCGASKTTDMISLRNGELKKFIITRDDRTITIDGNGNWSYNSPNLVVTQVNNGDVSFNVNSSDGEEVAKSSTQYDEYEDAVQVVEKVKTFTKKMFSDK